MPSAPFDPAMKQALINYRDRVCAVDDIVDGEAGPLTSQADKDQVEEKLDEAADIADDLLNDSTSDLYAPTSVSMHWTPIDTSGLNLTETARTNCERAQAALDEYCEGEPAERTEKQLADTARTLWESRGTFNAIIEKAGI